MVLLPVLSLSNRARGPAAVSAALDAPLAMRPRGRRHQAGENVAPPVRGWGDIESDHARPVGEGAASLRPACARPHQPGAGNARAVDRRVEGSIPALVG